MAQIGKMFDVVGKDLSIDFSQLFDLDGETKYNLFPISRKRVYTSIIEKIMDDLKYFFKEYPELPEKYLTLAMNIHEGEFFNGEDDDGKPIPDLQGFIDSVSETLIFDEELQSQIRRRVNNEYNISIETKQGEEELQFKDSYAKMVICISIMSRIVIPLICTYMEKCDIKKEQDITINVFNEIFKAFNVDETGEELDLAAKILRFITSSVENTLYSDKVIWEYLKNISVTDRSMIIDLFRKIVRDTIPKLDINKSIVSFLHVVIKHQILYQFTQNIKVSFKPISQIRTDNSDSNVSPFARVEMRLVAANEMAYVIEKENIKAFIDRKKMRFSTGELQYYMRNIQPNALQIRLMSHFVNSQDKINILACNREEYVYLLMITRQWLIEHKYYTLAALLIASIRPKAGRRNLNKGKLVNEIIQSKTYHNILSKYVLVQEKIEEVKPIIGFIGDILNTEFEFREAFNGDASLEKYLTLEDNPKPLITEMLSFLERM
jgi:hypothetical protein